MDADRLAIRRKVKGPTVVAAEPRNFHPSNPIIVSINAPCEGARLKYKDSIVTLQEFESRGQDYADLRGAMREIERLKAINAELLAACELALGFFFDANLDTTWLSDQIRAIVEHAKGES